VLLKYINKLKDSVGLLYEWKNSLKKKHNTRFQGYPLSTLID